MQQASLSEALLLKKKKKNTSRDAFKLCARTNDEEDNARACQLERIDWTNFYDFSLLDTIKISDGKFESSFFQFFNDMKILIIIEFLNIFIDEKHF